MHRDDQFRSQRVENTGGPRSGVDTAGNALRFTGLYEATINELNPNVACVSTKGKELRAAVVSALDSPLVMDRMADLVVNASKSVVNATRALLKKVGEFLEGAAVPGLFFNRAHGWVTDAEAPMIDIFDAMSPSHLISTVKWKGAAREAHVQAVSDRPGAAVAIAGVAACGTVAPSPVGLGVIALDGGVAAAELIAAGALLGVMLAACGGSIIEMKNALADFPGQEWPLDVKE